MIYLILFLISFSLTYFIKNYMIKKSLVATVNERSSHTIPTPHGGGIAIAITWFIGLFYLYFIGQIENNLFYALLFGAVISIVSFFDDIYELSPKLRLIIQTMVAIGGLYFLGGFETLTFGIFDIQNSIFTNIFAFFMIIWFINLYNFLDGINGYAGSEAIFLSLAGFILFGGNHFLVLVVAVLGFLYWNWNKAKIFMGDVGSTLLGYNVAIFTIYYANQQASNFWIWIILFSVYWFDATLTLIRRKLNKEKLSLAHKKHAYQRLTQAGWSHYKVTNYSIGLNILLFAIVYFISNIFVAFLFSFVVLVLVMKFIDSKKAFE
ncbi:MraY family glycosyltransferase [Aliarcobacter butzleri]|uniref:MraY family glycosyltransferase n=1 Tax=Aliarcobacter butzleri TaxID=28197 RepID=UPI00125F32F5|nr:glycosyltransferase family 4 protein [Aliarcobacter butzleri]MCT7560526.1 glycosyltransferase family 4 protein [Aliarcobacter butzleri]MCT7628531.1 glycosyltransferase family 4 protein [Aliarcobacter butzleri]